MIGWAHDTVRSASHGDFLAAFDGWKAVHVPDGGRLTDDDVDEFLAMFDDPEMMRARRSSRTKH